MIKSIIIDTNLWVSFLIAKDFNKLDLLIRRKAVKLLFSQNLLEEVVKVLARPKFIKYFSNDEVILLLKFFEDYGELVEVNSNLTLCRDSKDDFLLNLAIDGNADYLITGDKDLLILKEIKITKILTFSQFINLFNPSP